MYVFQNDSFSSFIELRRDDPRFCKGETRHLGEGSINPVIPRTQMCHGRECVLFHFLECEISPRGIIKGDLSSQQQKKVDLVANCTTFFRVSEGSNCYQSATTTWTERQEGTFFLVTLFVTSKLSGVEHDFHGMTIMSSGKARAGQQNNKKLNIPVQTLNINWMEFGFFNPFRFYHCELISQGYVYAREYPKDLNQDTIKEKLE